MSFPTTSIACTSCAHRNPLGSRFCNNCGAALSPSAPQDTLAPPTTLAAGTLLGLQGRYRIEQVLGQGGFGQAYRAFDQHLNRYCVVKRLAINSAWADKTRQLAHQNFRREAELLVSLNTPGHPNIPEIYEFLADDECLVMKYIEGYDLGRVMKERPGGLPEAEALVLVRDVCSALAYMHSRSPEPVLHRDIKPNNILIDSNDRVWLIDFGLAKSLPLQFDPINTNATQIAGTIGYTPPEQWRNAAEPRSDVYALCATLHTLLTGYLPQFTHADLADIVRGRKGAFPPLRQLKPELSERVEKLILRGMAINPAERPLAQALLVELEAILQPTGTRHPIETPTGEALLSAFELVTWCEQHWEAAAPWLYATLPNQIEQLWGKNKMALDLRTIAMREASDPFAALDAALATIDPPGFGALKPRLTTSSRALDFGTLATDARVERAIMLKNGGRRYLRLQIQVPEWISASRQTIGLRPQQEVRLSLIADMRRVKSGGKLRDEVVLHDNAGTSFRLAVEATISRWQTFWSRATGSTGRQWNEGQARMLRMLQGHRDRVWGLAFSPNGLQLASGSWDGTVRMWRIEDGATVRIFADHYGHVFQVAFSPDGTFFASTGGDETVRLWNIEQNALHGVIKGHRDYLDTIIFDPDERTILTSGGDYTICRWHLSDLALVQKLEVTGAGTLCTALSPNGEILATGSGDRLISLWNARDGTLLRTIAGHQQGVNGIAFNPSGTIIASAGADGVLRLWEVDDGSPLQLFRGHAGGIHSVAFCSDNQTLASGGVDGMIFLWDIATGMQIQKLNAHAGAVLRVVFSPDGTLLASGGGDSLIRFWKVMG